MAMTFSVPYNSDEETLRLLLAMQDEKRSIHEVYLSGPEAFSASGRVVRSMDTESFARIVSLIHSAGVRVNLVMNTVCEGVEWYETRTQVATRRYLEWACNDLGVESITVANPLYLKAIRRWLPNVELCASVLMDVDCVERARVAKDAGADIVTPDANVNRSLKTLKRIKEETGLGLKVMVNEGCLYKCPWRKFHFNAISHVGRNAGLVGTELSPEEFVSQCTQVTYRIFFESCNGHIDEDKSQLLKSQWIRPEDLELYKDVTTYFKISGRTMPRDALLKTVSAYMKQSFDGNVFELFDSSIRTYRLHHGISIDNKLLSERKFGERVMDCGHECATCGYCDRLARDLIKG